MQDTARAPYGDGNALVAAREHGLVRGMQPAPLTGTATA